MIHFLLAYQCRCQWPSTGQRANGDLLKPFLEHGVLDHCVSMINDGLNAALCNTILKVGIDTAECYIFLCSHQRLLKAVAGKDAIFCSESLDLYMPLSLANFLKCNLACSTSSATVDSLKVTCVNLEAWPTK